MSGTNQFLALGVGGGANTLTPTAYAALTSLLSTGFQSGVAPSIQFNTAFRQTTTMAAAIGQFIADQNINAMDDGSPSNLKVSLKSALDILYSQASVQGSFKNLQAGALGTSSAISVTADALVLSNGAGSYRTVSGVNLTINLANTVGQPLAISTGAWSANTWYAIYVWNNGTSTTGTADPSGTTPTAPAGYSGGTWMRVGWIRTDSTGSKYPLGFSQYGRRVQWRVAAGSNVTTWPVMATAQAWGAVGVSAFAPPTASRIRVQGQMLGDSQSFSIGPNSSTLSITTSAGCGSGANYANTTVTDEIQLESLNIYFTSNAYGLRSIGWEDNL